MRGPPGHPVPAITDSPGLAQRAPVLIRLLLLRYDHRGMVPPSELSILSSEPKSLSEVNELAEERPLVRQNEIARPGADTRSKHLDGCAFGPRPISVWHHRLALLSIVRLTRDH